MSIDKGLMADMTPEEREAMNAPAASGEIPRRDEPEAEAAAPAADESAAPAADDKPAEAAAEPVPAPAAPALPTYEAGAEDFAAKRATLETAADEAFSKWSNGDLDDAAYQAEQRRIQSEMMDVVRAEATAATLKQINEQHAKAAAEAKIASENAALQAINAASVKAGHIDYTKDAKAAAKFDALLSVARGDPDNAGKSFADIAAQVHAEVLATRGITAKVAAPPPAPAPRQIPQTLGTLPAAAPNSTRDSLDEALAMTSNPDEAEALWARTDQRQRAQALRQTMVPKH